MLHIVMADRGEPKFRCRVCRMPFYEGEHRQYEGHVIACSERHEDWLRSRSIRNQAPELYDPDVSGDVEFGKWVRANRKALQDGTMKM